MQESCDKDHCGGIFCEDFLKMRSTWQWQLPQLLISHFGGMQKQKTTTTRQHIIFLSELSVTLKSLKYNILLLAMPCMYVGE